MTDTAGTSEVVRAALTRAGRTQDQARIYLGMAASTWYQRMHQPGFWRLGELARLAEWLEMDVRDLIGEEGCRQ